MLSEFSDEPIPGLFSWAIGLFCLSLLSHIFGLAIGLICFDGTIEQNLPH